MNQPGQPGRPKRYDHYYKFALTEDQYQALNKIADLANDDVAETLRRMIERETPFFLFFASVNKRLPSVTDKVEP